MTVVYLDSVFLLNGVMDYLLFLTAATLAGVPLRRKRYVFAALLGAAYAAAVFLPGLQGLASFPAKIAVGVLLGLAAFGGEERFWRLLLLTLLVACFMAGSVFGLSLLTGIKVPMAGGIFYTDMDTGTLLLVSTGAYLMIRLIFRGSARHGMQGKLLDVTLCINGRQRQLTALWDSGNSLRSPLDGKPVLVIAPGIIEELLPAAAANLLTHSGLEHPTELLIPLLVEVPGLQPRLLPYQSVGKQGGLLLAVCCDWAEIGGKRHEKLLLALSPNTLGDGYSALWGGEKGGGYEILEMADRLPGKTKASGGPALYWRKRYVASAAGPGTGGRTADPAGRG